MSHLLIFGLGYAAQRIAVAARAMGWTVDATGSAGNIDFGDVASVRLAAAQATHILSSVPPVADGDPVLRDYAHVLGGKWLGYLSSTGVYGDTGGAWVDEAASIGGRRENRNVADREWLALGSRVFRLPGIYGPGRSALDRVAAGTAHRIVLPDQVFSRVHVDDIASAVIAGFAGPAGAYNIADDLPANQNAVMEAAAAMIGRDPPPFVGLATLSGPAQRFYDENRRVANGRARRVLGWRPRYPDFMSGLRALSATSSPVSATIPPAAASGDQR